MSYIIKTVVKQFHFTKTHRNFHLKCVYALVMKSQILFAPHKKHSAPEEI